MKSLALNAFPRTLKRRKGSKAVRASGRIPANIYGRHSAPQNLEVDVKEFDTLVHSAHAENILVDLTVQGDAKPQRLALVQDVQHHPLSGKILHVDFHEVKADETVVVHVPVEAVGTAVGVKNGGGVLEHVLFKLRVRALPHNLPVRIDVDVAGLDVGKSVHIGEIPVPANCEILGDKGLPVFTVASPKTEEAEATPAAGAEAAKQPEMLKEKKEEGTAAGDKAKADEKKPADKKK